jgi:hypothetical protein
MKCHHCKDDISIVWCLESHGRAYCSELCFTNRKGDPVLLYFLNDCNKLRLSALEYFAVAYMAKFKKAHPNPAMDYHEYLVNNQLPAYVVAFIKEKQQCEQSQQ